MGETQSVMLSSFLGTWLWGGSAAATRTSPLGTEGAGGSSEPSAARAAETTEAAAAAGGGRGDFGSLGDAELVPQSEARECAPHRLGRSTFNRTSITWGGAGRSGGRFDVGVSMRARRVSGSPERTRAAAGAVQKAHKCGKNPSAAASRDNEPGGIATQDATRTPDGPAEREFICSVCLELLWKPAVLDCGHSFCFWCAFQCMNVYDVSRCPLCKSTFDKFPPVSRPLDLFLLRHFPRTTRERDKEMEEFEAHRHRRSPCHSRIADLASGASTDALPAPHLQWLLEQKAPDLVRPPATQAGTTTGHGKTQVRRENRNSGMPCSATRARREQESASFCGTLQAGAAPAHGAQPSRRAAVGGTNRRGTEPGAGRRRMGGDERATVPGSGERAAVAETAMLSGRSLLGGDRVRPPEYAEHSVNPEVRMSTGVSRASDQSASDSTGRLQVTSSWETTDTQVNGCEHPCTSQRRSAVRSETVHEFTATTSCVPSSSNRGRETDRANAEAETRLVANAGFAAVTSLQGSLHSSSLAQGNRRVRPSGFEENANVPVLDFGRESEFASHANSANTHVPESTSSVRPGNFARREEPVRLVQPLGERSTIDGPVGEPTDTTRVFLPGCPESADRQTTAFTLAVEGSGESQRDRASSPETAVDEWDEWDGLDEGDISLGLLDPGERTTGHRRNPGDEPLQPMDIEEEEVSGYVDSVEEEFALSGEFGSASSHAIVTESGPTRSGGDEGEVTRPTDDNEIPRDAQETEENVTLFQQHPAFNENLLTPDDFVHYGVHCDGCGKMPIVGRRHRCIDCSKEACGFDLCGTCKDAGYDKPGRFDQNHSAVICQYIACVPNCSTENCVDLFFTVGACGGPDDFSERTALQSSTFVNTIALNYVVHRLLLIACDYSNKHKMKLVHPRDAEGWIQSLNRMKKIHPELTIHQILQWILVHYQEMGAADEQHREETTSPSRRESGRARAGFD